MLIEGLWDREARIWCRIVLTRRIKTRL